MWKGVPVTKSWIQGVIMEMYKSVRTISPAACVGCSMCEALCPTQAIEMVEDERGFLHPRVHEDSCTECGLCLKRCPVSDGCYLAEDSEPLACYAAYARDAAIRYESTSGGLFSVLAEDILRRGGIIYGASYDNDLSICHTAAVDDDGLAKLRQSKYAQSDKRGIFQKVEASLKSGIATMFVGCPCEIAALKRYLNKGYSNLILVDFLCLGVNSPKVYRAYIAALEKRYGSKVKRLWFKNKELGWNRFSTRVDFENGAVYRQDRYTDAFMRGYIIRPLYVRRSCTECKFKAIPHAADITLGDFWGIEEVVPGINSSHGVSVVLVNSSMGLELFQRRRGALEAWEVSYADARTPANRNAMTRSVRLDDRSADFFDDLGRYGFKKAIDRNVPNRFRSRMKRAIKRLLAKRAKL